MGLGTGLWLVLAVLLRELLEARMLTHALIQLPGLAIAGMLVAPRASAQAARPLALPALIVAIFAAALWMLPRMLDASLSSPSTETLKCLSIPLLVGLPLGWSWHQLSALTRAFVWSNLISMLLTLGWLYKAAPLRVCNYYLLSEQREVGTAYLILAAAIVVAWLPTLFFGPAPGSHSKNARSARPGAWPVCS